MNSLFEYAQHWLGDTAIRLYRPFDLALNRQRVQDIESGRPRFTEQLRLVALEALDSGDPGLVHKAIAILAVVGTPPGATRLVTVPPMHARASRTAIFEIEHRAPAG